MRKKSGSHAFAVLAGVLAAGGCAGRSELLGSQNDSPAVSTVSVEAGVVALTRIVVATDGTGQFRSVQDAVNSLAPGTTNPVEIDIKAGTYTERVAIAGHPFISLVGDDPLTTVIAYALDATDAGGTGKSATATVSSSDFSAQNITFENTAPSSSAQAVALYVSGDRQQFSNCRFLSYQDTVYVATGTQYFRGCYIQGDDDYILGASTAVFQDSTVYQIAYGVAVAAPSTPPTTPYGIVFLGGALTAAPQLGAGSVALGRPWAAYGSATYVGTTLGAHISAVGWVPMTTTDLVNVRFAEYETTGPGADPTMRADASVQLTSAQAAAFTLANIFGPWTPSFSQ